MDRTALQEMYSRYAGERTDGGADFTLDDHLRQSRKCVELGITVDAIAESLNIPIEYATALVQYHQN